MKLNCWKFQNRVIPLNFVFIVRNQKVNTIIQKKNEIHIMINLKNIPGLFSLLFLAVFISGCSNNEEEELKERERRALQQYLIEHNITAEPTASGLYYLPVVEGDGIRPEGTDYVEIEFTGELVDGTIFATTYDTLAIDEDFYSEYVVYGPQRFRLDYLLEGMTEGLSLMNEGGIATLIMPSDLALGSSSSYLIPSYSTLIYDIKLVTVIEDPDAYETALIQEWLDSNNIDRQASTDSVYYLEEVPGEGEFISTGDVISMLYEGYYLDGRVFDANIDDEEYTFSFPGEYMIAGWNIGLRLMKKGSKGTLLIPYKLGYGENGLVDQQGVTRVGPFMTILFDVEITDLH
jgi:FKBP-type peptidyl-prolyl cis-trans isomerase FkpA